MKTPLPNSISSLLGNVIPGKHVRIDESASAAPIASNKSPKSSCREPRITVIKSGESVSGIRVECSCGEVIELDCHY